MRGDRAAGGGRRQRHGKLGVLGSALRLVAALLVFVALTLAFLAVYQRVFSPFQPITSNSMAPQIKSGDAVMMKDVDPADVKVGQVIAFRDSSRDGQIVVHRVVAVDVAGQARFFTTRGDNIAANDEGRITGGQIVGAMSRSLPLLGTLLTFLSGIRGFVTCIGAPVALAFLLVFGLGLAESISNLVSRRRQLQPSSYR